MKKRAILAATAILAGSFNPVLTTTAWAAVTVDTPDPSGPSSATLDAMQNQCDALAAAKGPAWSGEVDESSIVPTYVSGPTEVGTHSIDDAIDGTLEGAGTFTAAHIEFTSDPYRNGGSVNMWANADSVGGYYSASTYDFEGEFQTKYSYAFDCNMTETVNHLVQGYYVVADDAPGNSADAIKANCDAFTEMGNDETRPPWWGLPEDHAFCHFVMTDAGGPEDEDRPPEAGTPIEETQTDTLIAHEDAGEGFSDGDTVSIGKVLVCISPTTSSQTKKGAPGTWTKKNGYTGDKCTTEWYNGGATLGVSNLNTGSNNVVTIPVILP